MNSCSRTEHKVCAVNQHLCSAAALASLFVGSPLFAQMPSFKYHEIAKSGDKSGGTSLVDVNKNGKLDFLVPHFGGSGIYYWYENAGSSWNRHTIGGPTQTDVGGCAFDVDGDGWVDAVTCKHWYRNLDGGSNWQKIPYGNLTGNHDVVGVDIDNDGKNDIVMSGCDIPNGPILLYENDGDGNFTRQVIAENLNQCFHSLAVADFNKSGHLDICAGGARDSSGPQKVYIWENRGGTGKNWGQHQIADVPQSHEMAIGDINGNGNIDIASKGWGTTALYWLENRMDTDTQVRTLERESAPAKR